MKPHSHKSHQNSCVRHLCFPVVLSGQFTFRESREPATPREARPGPSGALSTGRKQALLSQPLPRQLSHIHRKHAKYRTVGFCLSRPLLSCSQLQAIGLLCTKRLGRVAPLLGVRGFLPWQNDVKCVLRSGIRALLGHPRRRSMACPWPGGDAPCHNTQ